MTGPSGPAQGVIFEAAPAKVNLFLHVTARRGDGYHLLESLFVFADVFDRLQAEEAPELALRITGPQALSVSGGPENLVFKAAAALRQAAPAAQHKGALITLEKNLPVAAGLGGGSADAAAVLRLLMRLWRVDLSSAELLALALRLGADVPACLDRRAKLVSGIGEILVPLPSLPPFFLVLVNPGVSLSTARVFTERARRGEAFTAAEKPDLAGLNAEELVAILTARRNDLEAAASVLAPEIGGVLTSLSEQSGCRISRMSGSGATCYGLFLRQFEARAAAAEIAAAHPGWWVWSGPLAGSQGE